MTNWTLAGDIGGTKMAAALVDSNGQILFEKATLTQAEQGIGDVVERFATLAREVAASDGAQQPLACGVGVPGLIDSAAGEIRYAANLPGARNYPLRQQLEFKLLLPVVIDNDLRLHAIGERAFGAAQKANNFRRRFVVAGGGDVWRCLPPARLSPLASANLPTSAA